MGIKIKFRNRSLSNSWENTQNQLLNVRGQKVSRISNKLIYIPTKPAFTTELRGIKSNRYGFNPGADIFPFEKTKRWQKSILQMRQQKLFLNYNF